MIYRTATQTVTQSFFNTPCRSSWGAGFPWGMLLRPRLRQWPAESCRIWITPLHFLNLSESLNLLKQPNCIKITITTFFPCLPHSVNYLNRNGVFYMAVCENQLGLELWIPFMYALDLHIHGPLWIIKI